MSLALHLGNRPDLITSVYDGTALIAGAHLGHHEVVRRLMAGGAPLDHMNNLGWTALIEAVVLGDGRPDHVETVRALVRAGADRTIADRDEGDPASTRQGSGIRRERLDPARRLEGAAAGSLTVREHRGDGCRRCLYDR